MLSPTKQNPTHFETSVDFSSASFSAAVERLGLRTGVSGGEGVIMEMSVGAFGDLYVPKRYDSS